MSHEKVRSIKIENEKVFVTSKCNNDTEPVKEWECTHLTEILKAEGLQAAEIAILRAYEEGNFQSTGDNKYTRALRSLFQFPEYANFDWRKSNYDEGCPIQAARKSEDYTKILDRAMRTKPEQGKYILSKDNYGMIYFCYKVTSRKVKWITDKAQAKVFKYMEDIERIKSNYTNGNDYKVIAL